MFFCQLGHFTTSCTLVVFWIHFEVTNPSTDPRLQELHQDLLAAHQTLQKRHVELMRAHTELQEDFKKLKASSGAKWN